VLWAVQVEIWLPHRFYWYPNSAQSKPTERT